MLVREYSLHRPLELRQTYPTLGDVRMDTVVGRESYSVQAMAADGVAETLYFERARGLLTAWDVTMDGTELRTGLDDYRAVDGVMVPFRVSRERPDFSWSELIFEARQNVPVDSARFRKPSGN